MKRAAAALCVGALLLIGGARLGCAEPASIVVVKYRETPVDLAGFEHLDTTGSSFVGGAWYDSTHEYMIIRLRDTYYQYCRMPQAAWLAFKHAESFGSHYNAQIKGQFDCRLGGVPG